MNAANFIVFCGTIVQSTCGPEITAVTLSSGSFDLPSSIQYRAARARSLSTISVASFSAATSAL